VNLVHVTSTGVQNVCNLQHKAKIRAAMPLRKQIHFIGVCRGQFVFSPESSRKPHKYQATQQRIALFTAECAAEQNQLDVGVQFFSGPSISSFFMQL
jgi:hypothetical protein